MCLVRCVGSQHGQLTPRIRVFIEKLIVSHLVKKFPRGSLPCPQEIAACPCYERINSFYVLYPIYLRPFLISSSFHAQVFQIASFLQFSPSKPCTYLPSQPRVPHTAHTSSFLIRSLQKQQMRSTNHEAPYYSKFSSLQLIPLS